MVSKEVVTDAMTREFEEEDEIVMV